MSDLCVNCGKNEATHGWLCLACAIELGQVPSEPYPEQPDAPFQEEIPWWADEEDLGEPEDDDVREVWYGDGPGGPTGWE